MSEVNSHKQYLACTPQEHQSHDGIECCPMAAAEGHQSVTCEGPDDVATAGTACHGDSEEKYREGTVAAKGQDEATESGNAQHEYLDIEELKQESIPIGQRLLTHIGVLCTLGGRLTTDCEIGQIEYIGGADILRIGDDAREHCSQRAAAESAEEHDGDES